MAKKIMSIILVMNSKHKNSNRGDSESIALLKMLRCTMYEAPDGAWKLQSPSSHHHCRLQGLGLLDPFRPQAWSVFEEWR
jgi:hypothetical protein